MKAKLQMVVVIVAALLLAMLLGIMVTRASASALTLQVEPGGFIIGALFGVLCMISLFCIAVGIWHLANTEVTDADSK